MKKDVNEIFINIITPSIRPENLHKISESINIPRENYRWIVVFDLPVQPPIELIPENCEFYLHQDSESRFGNCQRNFALDLITDGYVYLNDDDTTIHPDLWDNIKNIKCDFISFIQIDTKGKLRLLGNKIVVGKIDSHNFLVKRNVVGNIRFNKKEYFADGIFANICYAVANNKCWIDKKLSIYNTLREM
jgi:hypothetical protein